MEAVVRGRNQYCILFSCYNCTDYDITAFSIGIYLCYYFKLDSVLLLIALFASLLIDCLPHLKMLENESTCLDAEIGTKASSTHTFLVMLMPLLAVVLLIFFVAAVIQAVGF